MKYPYFKPIKDRQISDLKAIFFIVPVSVDIPLGISIEIFGHGNKL